jgi:hypothetical protein
VDDLVVLINDDPVLDEAVFPPVVPDDPASLD